ncbi:MAG: helix-turn-helix domain-containing protein [Methanobacteriota archaeon]
MKEVVFELRGGRARAPHLACVKQSRTLTSETITAHVDAERAWEVNLLRGDREEVAAFRRALAGEAYPSAIELSELQGGDTWCVYFFEWRRPEPEAGVSVRHLLFDLLPGASMLEHHVGPGRSVFRALGRDAAGLSAFYGRAASALQGFYDVHLVYMGEPRFSPECTALSPEDLLFARDALAAGYYEEPRRASIRDLAAGDGHSKTAIAHRLRRIERIAIRELLDRAGLGREPALKRAN